jgi:hypothetical protein
MNLINLTSAQLNRAAKIKDQLDALNRQLSAILGGSAPAAVGPRAKGGMSAAGRARIVAAQKARWAKIKAGKAGASTASPKPAKRTMSAAAKAKIAAAARARWAKVRAAKKA